MKITRDQLYSIKRLALAFVQQMGTSNVEVVSYDYKPDTAYGLGARIELTLKNLNGFMFRFCTTRLNFEEYVSFENWLNEHKSMYEVQSLKGYDTNFIKYDRDGKYYAIPWEDIPSTLFVGENEFNNV